VLCLDEEELIAHDDSIYGGLGSILFIPILSNDIIPNGALTELKIVNGPAHGQVTLTPDSLLSYMPEIGFCGVDSFEYVICNSTQCDTAKVIVQISCDLIFLNGISPNGDGTNDAFTILGLEAYPNNEIRIFNRWGAQVFEASPYLNDWQGTWESSNLPDGTYFYLLRDGNGRTLSGHLQIHR